MKKMISILLIAALSINFVILSSFHLLAAEAAPPKMPLGATDYIIPSTQMTSTTAQWQNGVLSTGVTASGSMMSEAVFNVSGITATDDYIISFYSKLADVSSPYIGGVGIKLGVNELTFRGGNIFILNPNKDIIHTYNYEAGTNLQANTYFKVDLRLKPSAQAGKTDITIWVNGMATAYKTDYSWRTTVTYDQISPSFIFRSSDWNANTDFRGIRVYKTDTTATQFEPDNTIAEETGSENNQGTYVPFSSTIPKMPLGATDFITPSTQFTSETGDTKWEKGILSSSATPAASNVKAKSSFTVSGIGKGDDYVISFWTILGEGMTNYNGGVGIEFADNINMLLMPTIAYFTINGNPVPFEAACPLNKYFRVDIRIKNANESGKSEMQVIIDGKSIKSWEANAVDTIVSGLSDFDPKFSFFTTDWAASSDIRGIRVYKVDLDATQFEADTQPVAEESNGTNNDVYVPFGSSIPKMPLGAIDYITPATKYNSVTGNTKWENGILSSSAVPAALNVKAQTDFNVTGIQKGDDYVISFWTILGKGLTNYNGGVGVQFAENMNLLLMPTIAYFTIDGNPISFVTKCPLEKYFKVEIRIKKASVWGKSEMQVFVDGNSIKTWEANPVDTIVSGLNSFEPKFTFFSTNWVAASEIRGIRVYKVDLNATQFEADSQPVSEKAGSPANADTNDLIGFSFLLLAAGVITITALSRRIKADI